MTSSRKLAAIMFTDIVGYTALMGADEVRALDVLRKSRDIQKASVEVHGGKWLKEMGDGVLAQFSSALDAVKCAIDIQKKAHAELKPKIRIGIHLGDVTEENEDVFGDGVNIASRLQAIADPGGIYISESVHAAIGARNEIRSQLLGEVLLKNVDHPVKTYYLTEDWLPSPAKDKIKELSVPEPKQTKVIKYRLGIILITIAILIVSFLTSRWWIPNSNDRAIRLAVLPVVDLSGNESEEFIVDGIQSALIDEIGTISALQVISRTSSSKYRHGEKTIPEIARELNIDMVVESELVNIDDSVQLRLRLIRAFPDEQQLWRKVYSEATKDILNIYSNAALEISQAINIVLTPQERTQFARTQDVNPDAYKAYLKSQFHYNNFTSNDFTLGLQSLDLALQYDPNYVQAYMGIAQLWGGRQQMGLVSYAEAYPKIKAARQKALALNSVSSEAHEMLGSNLAFGEWKWTQAMVEFKKAIALNPNNSRALTAFSYLFAIMQDHDEAKHQLDLAFELDPFNPLIESFYGWNFLYARNYEDAVGHCIKSLQLAPRMWVAEDALRQAYYMLGKLDESFEVAVAMHEHMGMAKVAEALSRGYAEGGYRSAMMHAAEALVKRSDSTFVSPESIAEMYAYAGKNDLAMEWLEKAFASHDPEMHYLGVVPIYDGLRDRPRFQELVKKVNVPQMQNGSLVSGLPLNKERISKVRLLQDLCSKSSPEI